MKIGVIYDSIRYFTDKNKIPWDIKSGFTHLSSVNEIVHAIEDLGYNVDIIDSGKKFLEKLNYYTKRLEFIINLSRGYTGPARKALIPNLLDAYAIPYLGSDGYVQTLVRNKFHLKILAQHIGIPTPEFTIITDLQKLKATKIPKFPIIVKPCYESSSIGITESSKVKSYEQLKSKISHILRAYNQPVLVEKFVSGKEITVPIIGNNPKKTFGVVGITIDGKFELGNKFLTAKLVYDYKFDFMYPLTSFDLRNIEEMALTIYRFVGIKDYGRIDFRVDKNNHPFFIEAATQPDIIRHSDFFTIAKAKKLTYEQFIKKILYTAFKRYGLKRD